MVINIASFGGRTHLLDTARELSRAGHTVRFYSFVTDRRAEKFGLDRSSNRSLFWFAWPYLIWIRLFGFGGWGTMFYMILCDWLMCIIMKPCDVFIGQSPMHYRSLKVARKRWNAVTILERGTSHISEYRANIGGTYRSLFDRIVYLHDSRAYAVPDYISVGASHVRDGFVRNKVPAEKLFVNNYGFDSSSFGPTEYTGSYDIVMVGTWCYRKGCDRIVSVCREKGYKCLHVGPLGDMPLPQDAGITHVPSVEESELAGYYSQAKVFVLPSREEGLALVLMQAAACGLPIVCSQSSGGRDLRQYADCQDYIIETPDDTDETLSGCIDEALILAARQHGARNYMGSGLKDLAFSAYGRRYESFLKTVCGK